MASSAESRVPLLLNDAVEDATDFKGRPVLHSTSGNWRSAFFIIGVEVAERFAYYGIAANLISYLTGPLGQSTATAAENVNIWSGAGSLLPLVGAFVADSFLGRYRTIIIASVLYVLGLGTLTLSTIVPSSHSELQVILFFFSLYLVAVAQGAHKPCVQAFGADQFDVKDPKECIAKSSFFNWWYFCMCGGTLVTLLVLTYIQDNLSWSLGFGIPCISMAVALIVFLLGTTTYRFTIKEDERNPFVKIGQVFVASAKNWRTTSSAIVSDQEARGTLPHAGSQQFRFLNKALLAPDKQEGKVCTLVEVEEAKSVLRLVPIWATCLVYAVVFAQYSTFFTKQGMTLERSVGYGYVIPPSALQSFISLSIVIFIPIYDQIVVPLARSCTRKPSGLSMLQRIGIGMFLSIIAMVIAALVEQKRLKTAMEYGLVNDPKATIPMSIWWLAPQYILVGISDAFTMVGLQEFFYDQMPKELRSVGLALYLSIFGVGNFLSSFLIYVIQKLTGGEFHNSWFADNLNRAHLDYFYWLLTGLSVVGMAAYIYFAKSYIYKKGGVS